MSSEPTPEPEPRNEPQRESQPEGRPAEQPEGRRESQPEDRPADQPEDQPTDLPPSEAPSYADRCYRSPGALAGGVLLLLLGAWLALDALLGGDTRTRLVTVAGLLFAVPLVVAFTLRPAVYANARHLRVRNPFRTITAPWSQVEEVRAGYSSEVFAGGAKYQLWSIPVSLRARKRAARQTERAERAAARGESAAVQPGRPTGLFGLGGPPGAEDAGEKRAPSDQAVDELRRLAADNAKKPESQGEVTVRWAYEIAGPAVAGAVALAILLALG